MDLAKVTVSFPRPLRVGSGANSVDLDFDYGAAISAAGEEINYLRYWEKNLSLFFLWALISPFSTRHPKSRSSHDPSAF